MWPFIGLWTITLLAPQQNLRFERQLLADDLAGGYQVLPCDVNADGKLDLIALASGMTDLLWFENPTWQRHVLASNLPHMINAACWNRGGGQPPLIAVAYQFSMHPGDSLGIVSLLAPLGDPLRPWKQTEIDRLPTSHRLRWADIDGSGNKVLINVPLAGAQSREPEYRGHVPLVFYRPDIWKRQSIGLAEQGIVHGIFVTDWYLDGRDSVLIAGVLGIHLYTFGKNKTWQRIKIANGGPQPWPHSGTSDVTVGRLRSARYLAAIEPWHGNEIVVYRPRAASWQRTVIDDTLLDAHTIQTADLDGDGQDEIIAGFRGKPYGVYVYHWSGSKWIRQTLDQGAVSAASCAVTNLLGTNLPDLVCIGSATRNLVLYRNTAQ